MSNHDLNPGPFCGRKSEDAEAWLKAVMNWVVYKRLNAEAAMAAVALLLKEGALQWFYNLQDDIRSSMADFTREFKQRYITPNETNRWKDIVAVYEVKQTDGQSVNDYIDLVQKKGLKAEAKEEQVLAAIIGGLRPSIRQSVLQHEPRTVQDIRKWGSVAESAEGQEGGSSSALSAAVEEMKRQSSVLSELKEQFQSIQVRGISRTNARSTFDEERCHFEDQGQRRPGSSPSPEDYTSSDWNQCHGRGNDPSTCRRNVYSDQPRRDYNYGARDYTNDGEALYHEVSSTGYGEFNNCNTGDRFQQPFERYYGECEYERQPDLRNGSPQSNSVNPILQYQRGGRPQMFYNSDRRHYTEEPRNKPCGNCGRMHEWGQCPAWNSQCRRCLRPHHWSSMCRSNQQF